MCVFLQARYSVLQPGGYIRPHCGGFNNRLRLHLALQAPAATGTAASLSVNGSVYKYTAGKAIVFDDTFEVRDSASNATVDCVPLALLASLPPSLARSLPPSLCCRAHARLLSLRPVPIVSSRSLSVWFAAVHSCSTKCGTPALPPAA